MPDMQSKVRLPMSLDDWVRESYATATKKGFHEDPVLNFLHDWDADEEIISAYLRTAMLARLGLIHTEVSEMMQLVKRHGVPYDNEKLKNELGEEGADVFIRLGDFFGEVGIGMESHVYAKNQKNLARPYKYNTPDEVKEND